MDANGNLQNGQPNLLLVATFGFEARPNAPSIHESRAAMQDANGHSHNGNGQNGNGNGANGHGANGSGATATPAGLGELEAQLADPAKAALLREIFENLELIAFSLRAVDGTLRRAETLTENVGEGLLEARAAIDPEVTSSLGRLVSLTPELVEGLEALSPALESDALAKLGDPQLVESLARLAEHRELLVFAADAAAGFLERSDAIVESFAGCVREALDVSEDSRTDLLEMLSQTGKLLPGVTALVSQLEPLVTSGAIEHLAESKILAPEMVDVVAKIGDALHATEVARTADPSGIGLVGLLKTLRDPDAQRAMAYLATFAKEFGRRIQ